MTEPEPAPATRTAHRIIGPYGFFDSVRYAADCSCGWMSAIYATSGEAISAFADHVAEATET